MHLDTVNLQYVLVVSKYCLFWSVDIPLLNRLLLQIPVIMKLIILEKSVFRGNIFN